MLVNGGGAVSGGAKTLMIALTRELGRGGDRGLDWEFLVPPELVEIVRPGTPAGVTVTPQVIRSPVKRILWEQVALVRGGGDRPHDVLFSAFNFGPLLRRHRHVLLTFNALHFAEAEMPQPIGRRARFEGMLGRASARMATVTVTPTAAMAARVRPHTRRPVVPIAFGPGLVTRRTVDRGPLFVFADRTGWARHKRLVDLLTAVKLLAGTHGGRFVVRTGCDPRSDFASRFPESVEERRLLADPAVAAHVEVGWFTPEDAMEVTADAVVVTSVIESLCFPIVEAVSVGVPVVASDSDFARELCGDGAFYVPPRDPPALARAMARLVDGELPPSPSPEEARGLDWESHADQLAAVCHGLAAGRTGPLRAVAGARRITRR